MRDLLLLNIAASLFRILVYPSFEERYFVTLYAVVAISLVSVLASFREGSERRTIMSDS
jgi:hypothetical protein